MFKERELSKWDLKCIQIKMGLQRLENAAISGLWDVWTMGVILNSHFAWMTTCVGMYFNDYICIHVYKCMMKKHSNTKQHGEIIEMIFCRINLLFSTHVHFTRRMHYDDVRMGAIASQITSLTIIYSIVYSDADQRKHQSSASLAFVWGIHRGPVNFPHKWPVKRKMFPFDDVIMAKRNFLGLLCLFPNAIFFLPIWGW